MRTRTSSGQERGRSSSGSHAPTRRPSRRTGYPDDAHQRGLEILLTKAPSTSEEELIPWLKTVVMRTFETSLAPLLLLGMGSASEVASHVDELQQAGGKRRTGGLMSSFDLVIASLFPDPGTMTGALAGPGAGVHASGDWFVRFGNDLGALQGTAMRSICDGRVTKLDLTHATPETFTPKIYGAGVFVRARSAALNPDDPGGVGLFYTHIDVQPVIAEGADVVRGQVIGTVVGNPPIPPHLHFAIAERRGGQNFGVDIFQVLVEMANKPELRTLSFFQDGSPPQVTPGPAPQPPSGS